jgi:hypothetical protein
MSKTYRVPVEFQAESDEAARTLAQRFAIADCNHDYFGFSERVSVVVDDMQAQETYWTRVSPPAKTPVPDF